MSVTQGHRRVVAWMATSALRDLVDIHRVACGSKMSIYFRPTDQGLVRLALHPQAPGYVGFRTDAKDKTYLLRPGCLIPWEAMLQERVRAFEAWLPKMKRASDEEQGVIPWLRAAVDGDLSLPSLGDGWVFLHQEWRWTMKGTSQKSDVLAVHVPTGRLGIVEFKSTKYELSTARQQVDQYAGYWGHQAQELAPFFTDLLRAMGAAYGNEAMCRGRVDAGPAQLFVGVASPQRVVQVCPR